MKAVTILVHNDRKRHTVQPCDDAAIIFRRAPVDGNGVALGGIADAIGALIQHIAQHDAAVIRRATDQKILGRWPPSPRKPVQIGLKATAGQHKGTRKDAFWHACNFGVQMRDTVRVAVHMQHLRFIGHLDPQILCGVVIGVNQSFATAQKKRIGAA